MLLFPTLHELYQDDQDGPEYRMMLNFLEMVSDLGTPSTFQAKEINRLIKISTFLKI